jgi:hypothetical protein
MHTHSRPTDQLTDSDEDFNELEALLNPKPTPDSDEPDEVDELDELEALLGEAMADKKLAENVKASRAKAKGGFGLSAEDLERIRKWELAREWQPVANVALFHRYTCQCGFHATLFEGLMLEQHHRADSHANRWTSQETEQPALPSKTAIRKSTVPLCQRCAAGHGYSLVTDMVWEI